MEANRKEAFLSTHPQPLSPHCPHKQTEKRSGRILRRCRYGFLQALILLSSSLISGWIIPANAQLKKDEGLFSEMNSATFYVSPETVFGCCHSYGNINACVCKRDSAVFVVSEGKYFIVNQEIIVVVRLNHTHEVCKFFWVKRWTETSSCWCYLPVLANADQMQRDDPWRRQEFAKPCSVRTSSKVMRCCTYGQLLEDGANLWFVCFKAQILQFRNCYHLQESRYAVNSFMALS